MTASGSKFSISENVKIDFDKYNSNTLFVMGGENQGISKLTAQKCDVMIKINMKGEFNSLNVSNAAAILMFEFLRQQEV